MEAAHDQRQERVRGGRRVRRRQRRQARHRLGRHLVSGPRLDAAPRPRRRRARGPTTTDFATLPMDVNGDGQTDFVTCAYFAQERRLGREPGQGRARTGPITRSTCRARARRRSLVDLTGDGMPDVLPNTDNVVVWYELAKAGGKEPDVEEARLRHGGRRPRRRLGRRQRRRPGRPAHPQGLVRGPGRPARPRPGPGTPMEPRRRPASRSSPATSTATASPTSSTAWATTTACSG